MTNETTTASPADDDKPVLTSGASLMNAIANGPKAIKEIDSFEDLFSSLTDDAPIPESAKNASVKPMTQDEVGKIVPELTDGLVDPETSQPRPGTLMKSDPDGKFGEKGAVYICRFVEVTPELAKYVLNNCGQSNRTSTASRLKAYTQYQKDGNWDFVFNTAIFTVGKAGRLLSSGLEQHNCGHSMKACVESGKTILVLFCFGVPKSQRDKIDDSQARSAKDIASTKTEIKTMFAKDAIVAGSVKITAAMASKMQGAITETQRIVEDIRSGKQAKTGGSRDKHLMSQKLDAMLVPLCSAISEVQALDSKLETTGLNKEGEVKVKTSGGFTKRINLNHAAAALTLAATYKALDGTYKYDPKVALQVMKVYAKIGNEKLTDKRSPAISLRNAIDRWNNDRKHKDSGGMNVRFAALKIAINKELAGEIIEDQTYWDQLVSTSGGNFRLCGFRSNNPDAIDGIVGVDDWVDPAERASKKAGVEGSAAPLPAIPEDDDEDMTEPTSDSPIGDIDE